MVVMYTAQAVAVENEAGEETGGAAADPDYAGIGRFAGCVEIDCVVEGREDVESIHHVAIITHCHRVHQT